MPCPDPGVASSAFFDATRPTLLHPIFDMNMPEGALKNTLLAIYGKALPVLDDYALLGVTGLHGIGKVRCHPLPTLPHPAISGMGLSSLLKARGTQGLFHQLLQQYAQFSGVSGVQPKILVQDDGSMKSSDHSPINASDRTTVQGATHIVKSFDAEKYPDMALNEFLCLKAARKAGLATPEVDLANDGGLLVIQRFDLRDGGTHRGFEDGCALAGLQSSLKYDGSYEQLAKTFRGYLSPSTPHPLLDFFKSVVLSCTVRNGDAHRKNFGVLYDDATACIHLAPTFDVITSTVYVESDMMALTLNGSKRWPGFAQLRAFGTATCNLPPAVTAEAMSQVAEAVADMRSDLAVAGGVGAAMLTQWESGLHSTHSKSVTVATPAEQDKTPEPPKAGRGR